MSIDENEEGLGASEPLPLFEEDDADAHASEAGEDVDSEYILRRQQPERRAPRQLWLISYSDFMTILMIFFLAMYGYTYLAKAALLKNEKKISNYSQFTTQIQELQKSLGSQLRVQNDVDKIVIQLSDKILFASGSASVEPAAGPTLEELANSIKLVDGDVIVQGHTDNVPIRGGRYRSNWELSTARAFSVIKRLTEAGVPAQRLAAWGLGENRPITDNLTPEHRAENRRIEVVILKKK